MEKQLLDFYVSLKKDRKKYSANTIAAYKNDTAQFLKFLQDQKDDVPTEWSQVSPNLIENYIVAMGNKPKPYAPSTVARKVAAIKALFLYLKLDSNFKYNPATEVKAPKVQKKLPKTLSFEEVETLLEAPIRTQKNPADKPTPKCLRDLALLKTLYATGMRVSEIVALKLGDVNLEENLISSPADSKEIRTLPLEETLRDVLELYLAEGRPFLIKNKRDKALFLNHRGKKLTRQGLWLIIKSYAERSGLGTNITPHTLRHSFAAHQFAEGASLLEIKQLLGHVNISTTQIYKQLRKAE